MRRGGKDVKRLKEPTRVRFTSAACSRILPCATNIDKGLSDGEAEIRGQTGLTRYCHCIELISTLRKGRGVSSKAYTRSDGEQPPWAGCIRTRFTFSNALASESASIGLSYCCRPICWGVSNWTQRWFHINTATQKGPTKLPVELFDLAPGVYRPDHAPPTRARAKTRANILFVVITIPPCVELVCSRPVRARSGSSAFRWTSADLAFWSWSLITMPPLCVVFSSLPGPVDVRARARRGAGICRMVSVLIHRVYPPGSGFEF